MERKKATWAEIFSILTKTELMWVRVVFVGFGILIGTFVGWQVGLFTSSREDGALYWQMFTFAIILMFLGLSQVSKPNWKTDGRLKALLDGGK